jgi:site-specific DNA-cytosine methylase
LPSLPAREGSEVRYLSLFSGIEAASVAAHPLGWEAVGLADIEPFPNAVTAHYYPSVPNLGNVQRMALVAKFGEEKLLEITSRYPHSRLARIYARIAEAMLLMPDFDVVVFGSPCQDLSVAGKRAGLQGERSGLFYDAMLVVRWARRRKGCRFALWENVPGAFSSNKGADFAVVVGALAGADDIAVPPKGWGNEGAIAGPEALVEWSTLDAQWFGVAQRRRRVFAFADFGDWSRRPPVLLEPEGLRGNSAPRREAGQGVAGTLESRTRGGGFPGSDGAAAGHVVPAGSGVTHALTGNGFDASEDGTGRGTPLVPIGVDTMNADLTGDKACTITAGQDRGNRGAAVLFASETTSSLCAVDGPKGVSDQYAHEGKLIAMSSGQANAEITEDHTPALTCLHEAPIIVGALTAKGPGAMGAPEVDGDHYIVEPLVFDETQITSPTNRSRCQPGAPAHTLQKDARPPAIAYAFDCKRNASDSAVESISPTLRAMDGGRANGGGQVAVAFQDVALPVTTRVDRGGAHREAEGNNLAVAFQSSQSGVRVGETHATLDSNNGSRRHNGVVAGMQVRRLTPRECERLQGFQWRCLPNTLGAWQDAAGHWWTRDYTLIPIGKKMAADGPRYKALGNSMAVPVMRWIFNKIDIALFVEQFL